MPAFRVALLAIVALVVLNLFLATSYAQPQIATVTCILTGTSMTPGDCIGSALPLALIGILLSIVFGAIVFMIGEVFNYRPLKGFYKRELWETLKSAIIIAIIFSVLIIASSIAVSFAGNAPSTSTGPVKLTDNLAGLYTAVNTTYLQPQIQSGYKTFGGLMGLSVGTDILKTFTLSTWLPIPIWLGPLGIVGAIESGSVAPLLQSNYIDSLTKNSFSLISIATIYNTTVLIVFLFQSDLLYVIAAVGLGVLIPIGIIMRAIPFIRGIGGTLIALGIGMSIVYPVLLLALNLPATNYIYGITTSTPGQASSSCPSGFSGLICKLWSGFAKIIDAAVGATLGGTGAVGLAFGTNAASSFGGTTSLGGVGFWTGLLGPLGFYGSGKGIFPALNFVVDNSLDQIVQFILFVLDIIIGYAIINGIANILGGKVTLGIGKRFKLA